MNQPHQVFGEKLSLTYHTRPGAYLVAFQDGKAAVIQTQKGFFLPGGGMEPGETREMTILRECREETGCCAEIDAFLCSAECFCEIESIGPFHPVQFYYLGRLTNREEGPSEPDHQLRWIPYASLKGNMYSEMQSWALDQGWKRYCPKNP